MLAVPSSSSSVLFRKAACTTVTSGYWEQAMAVRRSFLRHHPEAAFYILVVDGPAPGLEVPPGVEVVWGRDLPVEGFLAYAMRYDAMELITSLKAPFLRFLLGTYERVIHLDADVLVFDGLEDLFERLGTASVVLTPHIVSPLPDSNKPGEVDLLAAADHNSGFIGFNNSGRSLEALWWLEQRCREACYDEPSSGLCTDQKWYNLLPALFEGVFIERSPRFNVAYWNLHERHLVFREGHWWVNGSERLGFFHFSGCSPLRPNQLTKFPSRFNLENRPELRSLVQFYFDALAAEGWPSKTGMPYRFLTFSDGRLISPIARQAFAALPRFRGLADPFDAGGDFYAFCKRWNQLGAEPVSVSYNRWNTPHDDWRLRLIRCVFKLALRLFGAERYATILNHLQWALSIRNHGRVLFGAE